MSKPQTNVMLVSIALTAASLQYARRAPAQNVSTRRNGPRPETHRPETEMLRILSETETKP